MLNDSINSILVSINSTPLTPFNICLDMISLLDDKGFFDKPDDNVSMKEYIASHRVCDIYCKSGDLLAICYFKFVKALSAKFKTPEELDYFIWRHLLYAICPSADIAYMLTKKFYRNNKLFESDASMFGHFYVSSMFRDKDVENHVPEELKDMKFDVVVGNPPYNDDIYLDFLDLAHSLSNGYVLQIAPAKFEFSKDSKGLKQAKFDTFYKHVEYVDFWQCEGEIFKITQPCGIAVYLAGVDVYDTVSVKNSSNIYKTFKSDITVIDKMYRSFSISAISILRSLGCFNDDFMRLDLLTLPKEGKYCSLNFKQICVVGGSKEDSPSYFYRGDRFEKDGFILNNFVTNEGLDSTTRICVFADDNKLVVDSFNSYCNSRLVRFCVMVGTSTYGNSLDRINWRFVPKPEAFDHIFTDGELYKKYNLSDEDIAVIESVIRERK